MKSRTIELGDFTVSRHAAALRALLATYRIETPQKALERIAPAVISAIIAAIVAWLYPAEWWGKVIAGAITLLIVIPIQYALALRKLSREPNPPVKIGLSPLYTREGRNQLRAEQLAKDNEIARLSFETKQLAAAMAKLDITTEDGQQKLKQLADQKKPIDERLAELEKLPTLRLGYVPGD